MKRIIGILTLIALVAIIVVQLKMNKTVAENRVYVYDKEAPIPVFAEVISNQENSRKMSYSGNFEALNEVKISAESPGVIEEIYISEGDEVRKGQILLKINDDILVQQVDVLNTKIKGLEDDKTRYTNLLEKDAVPGIKLEKTLLAIETLNMEKKVLLEQLSNTTIKAPFDGFVSMKFCEKGGFAAPGIPLFEIVNQDQMKFVIQVPEKEVDLFNGNVAYKLHADIDSEEILTAQLLQISRKGNLGNSYKIEFLINSTELDIKSKMFGRLEFNIEANSSKSVEIPSKAIIGSESHPEIYLIENGKVVRTKISITSRNGEYLIINKGVSIGDTIVTGGFINLFDNANVVVSN